MNILYYLVTPRSSSTDSKVQPTIRIAASTSAVAIFCEYLWQPSSKHPSAASNDKCFISFASPFLCNARTSNDRKASKGWPFAELIGPGRGSRRPGRERGMHCKDTKQVKLEEGKHCSTQFPEPSSPTYIASNLSLGGRDVPVQWRSHCRRRRALLPMFSA